jgi:hypothetical protein
MAEIKKTNRIWKQDWPAVTRSCATRGIIQRDAVRIFKWTDTTLHLFSKKWLYGYNKRELLKRGGGKI